MNVSDFYKYLTNSNFLNSTTLNEINEVIQRYPYFQAARLLYLKNLHILKDDIFQAKLEENSIFFSDRKVVYNYINKNNFSIESDNIETSIQNNTENTDNNNKQIVENIVHEKINMEKSVNLTTTENSTSNNLTEKTSIADEIIKKIEQIKSSQASQEKVKEPTNETNAAKKDSKQEELLTFDEWLQHISKRKTFSSSTKNTNKTDTDVINEFLSKADNLERIKPVENESQLDLTENLTPPEELEIVSENLAQLYYKQGYYEKALKMYEKLFLQYPEKSIYFATIIQEIKQKLDKN